VVVTAGSFDLLVEVVCEDDHLLDLLATRIRAVRECAAPRPSSISNSASSSTTGEHDDTSPQHVSPEDDHRRRPRSSTPGRDADALSAAARDSLWMHFTALDLRAGRRGAVIVRGQGAYIWDSRGRRYLDGLAGLFTVQVGHGREELAEAAAKQAASWRSSRCGPTRTRGDRARRAAGATRPGDLNRVFFTTGGGEAVETAWKLAKQYFKLTASRPSTR
jgi:4-aminobutyrate aminotransferase-like enzyme